MFSRNPVGHSGYRQTGYSDHSYEMNSKLANYMQRKVGSRPSSGSQDQRKMNQSYSGQLPPRSEDPNTYIQGAVKHAM